MGDHRLGQEWGWTSPRLRACLAVALIALAMLALIEHRVREPIIDLTLLHERVFTSALVSLTLAMLALFGISFLALRRGPSRFTS